MMKRLVYICIAAIILSFCILTGCSSDSPETAPTVPGLYIETSELPKKVTKYALSVFSGFDRTTFSQLGFTQEEIEDISLSPGIRMINAYTGEYYDNNYYFFIKSGGSFIGILLISDTGGDYSFQIQRSRLAEGFNRLERSVSSYFIYRSEAGYFGKCDSSVYAISAARGDMQGTVTEIIKNLTNGVIPPPSNESTSVDMLSSIAEFDALENKESGNRSKLLKVPLCDNENGTCWASCVASTVVYRMKGEDYGINETWVMRDKIVSNRISVTGSSGGTIDTVCLYINLLLMENYHKTTDKLSYREIETLIDNSAPAVIQLSPNLPEGLHHAVILAGYSYNPKSSDSKMYFIMDPNYPFSYVGISYDSPYCPYEYFISQTDFYSWSITAVDKDII